MRSLSLWSALLVCTLSVHSYILIHTRTVVGYLQSGLFRWLELRRLPPIMGFVGSEGQGW